MKIYDFSKAKEFTDEVLIKKKGIPSVDIKVIKENEVVFDYRAGYFDYEKTVPIHENALYYMYSCTKPVTVTAALRLYEENKLDLEVPVSKYLPEYEKAVLKKDGEIVKPTEVLKVKHLFTMTGGFTYDWTNPLIKKFAKKNPKASTVELANQFVNLPLIFEPGERFEYSLCHDILAAVVESIVQKPFREYVKEVLFDPVGMKDSYFHITEELKPYLAAKYDNIRKSESDSFKITPIPKVNNMIFTENYDSGGAGLICTLSDYAKFAETLANGGVAPNGYRFLKEETIALLTKDWLKEICKDSSFGCTCGSKGYSYGLGVRVKTGEDGRNIPVGEFGWDGACGSYVSMNTEHKTAVVMGMHVHSWNQTIQDDRNRLTELIYEALGF
ncbi:MAG: beta-lactamase family protein [Ruminococcaceae bacterium]|nr:beta-lactamase family protein [Oscillospiraceae bacterium]